MNVTDAKNLEDLLRHHREFSAERKRVASISDGDCEVRVGDDGVEENFVTNWAGIQSVMIGELDKALAGISDRLSHYKVTIE